MLIHYPFCYAYTITHGAIGNLISSKWGVRQIPTNTQPIGLAGADAGGVPIYLFPTDLKSTFTPDPGFVSRWQAQIGLRYSF